MSQTDHQIDAMSSIRIDMIDVGWRPIATTSTTFDDRSTMMTIHRHHPRSVIEDRSMSVVIDHHP
jgi:hypothetical protein